MPQTIAAAYQNFITLPDADLCTAVIVGSVANLVLVI
jgi:hypothetical protein